MGFRGSLRADFDKTIDQSNVNGFSWIFFFINYSNKLPPHVRGQEGPLKSSAGARSRGP